MTLPRHATRHRTRRKLATGAPTAADLLAWELCWNSVDGKLWIGTGDDGNGNATGVAQLTGGGVSVAWADITGKPVYGVPTDRYSIFRDFTYYGEDVSYGPDARGNGTGGTAFGGAAKTWGNGGVAFGRFASAGYMACAIGGQNASAMGAWSTVIGSYANDGGGESNTIIGAQTQLKSSASQKNTVIGAFVDLTGADVSNQVILADGEGNIRLQFSGATPITALTWSARQTFASEAVQTSANAYRIIQGSYGTFWLNNGVDLYLMVTASGDQYGSYSSLRPFTVNLSSGLVKFGEKVTFGKSFYLAANDGGYTSAGYTAQGMWLAWNPSNGGGESAFVNNQGGGSGGFAFVNRTSAGVYSVLATLAPTGAALNSQTLGAGVLRVNALGLPGTTAQYVRGDGSLATLPTSGSGDITGVTAGDGLTGGATSGNATVSMGTPGTCTASTGNSATGSSHTHALTGVLPTANPSFTGTLTGPALTLGGGDKLTKISVQSTTPSSSSANSGTLYLIY